MFPISLLIVPISGFLQFSKAAKWTRITWEIFIIWISMLSSIPSTSSGSWTKALQVMLLCLHFGSPCYGCTIFTNNKEKSDLLWADGSRLIIFILFLSLLGKPEHFKVKTDWSDTSIVWNHNSKSLLRPFSTWIFTGYPMSTKEAHMDPTFVVQSPPRPEMTLTVDL